jgi:1,4-dihydroxy-2-naphthoate polyprenyltransferase
MARPANRLGVWTQAVRPKTLPAAIAPVMVAGALAWRDGVFNGTAALLCLIFGLLIQIGTNFANDYYDFVKGADPVDRVGPTRAVAAGWVAPAVMHRAMWGVLITAFLLGLTLVYWGGMWLIVIGLLSVICAIAYTGGPYPLGYNGLGDVFVFIFFGLVAVGATYYVQAGMVSTDAMSLAVPIGLLATNILLVNNYRDVETDRVAGKRTTVVRFGRGYARGQFSVGLLIAFGILLYRYVIGGSAWELLPLLWVPMAWSQHGRLRESKTPSELIKLLGDTGKLLALYALTLSLGLVLSRV